MMGINVHLPSHYAPKFGNVYKFPGKKNPDAVGQETIDAIRAAEGPALRGFAGNPVAGNEHGDFYIVTGQEDIAEYDALLQARSDYRNGGYIEPQGTLSPVVMRNVTKEFLDRGWRALMEKAQPWIGS